MRTFALTDFVEARAARRAAIRGIAEHDPSGGHLLLDDRRAAVADAGRRSGSTRSRPRTAPAATASGSASSSSGGCAQTPLVLAMSDRALPPLNGSARPSDVVVVPCPVEPSGAAPTGPRRRRGRLCRQPREEAAGLRARRRGPEHGAAMRRWSSPAPTSCRRPTACELAGRLAPAELPGAAAARSDVRRGAAARGLRDRAARGARRRLHARHDSGARSVPGARPRPRARSAPRRRGSGPSPASRARRSAPRLRAARSRSCSSRSPARPSTGPSRRRFCLDC